MLSLSKTTLARYSKFTWCTIPNPGGTILKFSKADCPHFKNSNLYRFLSNYFYSFWWRESWVLAKSTWIEWSITKSTGHSGFTLAGSPPNRFTASLNPARSTTKGTPVRSWRMTLEGLNGTSVWNDNSNAYHLSWCFLPVYYVLHVLLFNAKLVAVSKCTFQQNFDRNGQAVNSFIV
jgi:hypothetical protein